MRFLVTALMVLAFTGMLTACTGAEESGEAGTLQRMTL